MRAAGAALLALTLASSVEAAVFGLVVDGAGQPVPGAAVTAYAREGSDERALRLLRGSGHRPLAGARSGPDGAFTLDAPTGLVLLDVRAPGFAPAFVEGEGAVVVTLTTVALKRGRVTAEGRPVAARIVFLSGGNGEWETESAADGSFAVPDPASWASQALVFHPGFALAPRTSDWSFDRDVDLRLEPGVTIEGRVLDERQRPVAEATVWVGAEYDRWPQATTGADGRFRVAHAATNWSSLFARGGPLAGSAGRAASPVSVVVGPARSLAGTVRSTDGPPLSGVVVTIARGQTARSVVTDGQGRFVADGLLPSEYTLGASREGYERPGYEGLKVDLRGPAAPRPADLTLEPLPAIRGRVVDEAHRPVAGAFVAAGMPDSATIYGLSFLAQMDMDISSTRSGADGSFRLPVPAERPGAQDARPLLVQKPGYAALRMARVSKTAPVTAVLSRGVELRGRTVDARGAPLAGVEVTIAEDGLFSGMPIRTLIGRVGGKGWASSGADGTFAVRVNPVIHHLSFRGKGLAPKLVRDVDPRAGQLLEVVMAPSATIQGRVLRADGAPVAGALVALSDEGLMVEPTPPASTDARGGFALDGLLPGSYTVTASWSDLGLGAKARVQAPASDLVIRLGPLGALRGRVRDAASHQPLTAFDLVFDWPGEGDGTSGRTVPVRDPGGVFLVNELPATTVAVSVRAPGHAPIRHQGVEIGAEGEPTELEIDLPAEATIQGRVTDEEQRGVTEVSVSARGDANSGVRSSTDDQGVYELHGLAPGAVEIAFEAQDYVHEERRLEARPGARLDVTLRRGLSLSGEVVTDDGRPAENASVVLVPAGREGFASTQGDAQGRFRIQGLEPGRYQLEASSGIARATLEDVEAGRSGLHLVLASPRTAVLSGHVSGLATSDDALWTVVHAVPADGARQAQAPVDMAHAFRMADAPTGVVRVQAQAVTLGGARQSSRAVELDLAPGSETEVTLEFASDSVSGQVTGDGAPVAGATVTFTGAGVSGAAVTDALGRYQVLHLDPGAYEVEVSGEGSSYATQFTLAGTAEFDIDITGAGLQGRVVRADGGEPVPGVEVALWALGGRENAPAHTLTTNGRGEFVQGSVKEGRYRLTTSKAGFGQEVRELELTRGVAAPLEIQLTTAAGIDVAVVDARDGQLLEAIVVVRDGARRIVANRHSGAGENGTVNIPLSDGAYVLSVSASGYGTVTRPVAAPVSGLRIGLTPGGTLVIESARALQGRARLVQPDGEEYVRCWCNGIADITLQGRRTTVEHVAAGSYTLEVLVGEDVVSRQPVVISEGQRATVTID